MQVGRIGDVALREGGVFRRVGGGGSFGIMGSFLGGLRGRLGFRGSSGKRATREGR